MLLHSSNAAEELSAVYCMIQEQEWKICFSNYKHLPSGKNTAVRERLLSLHFKHSMQAQYMLLHSSNAAEELSAVYCLIQEQEWKICFSNYKHLPSGKNTAVRERLLSLHFKHSMQAQYMLLHSSNAAEELSAVYCLIQEQEWKICFSNYKHLPSGKNTVVRERLPSLHFKHSMQAQYMLLHSSNAAEELSAVYCLIQEQEWKICFSNYKHLPSGKNTVVRERLPGLHFKHSMQAQYMLLHSSNAAEELSAVYCMIQEQEWKICFSNYKHLPSGKNTVVRERLPGLHFKHSMQAQYMLLHSSNAAEEISAVYCLIQEKEQNGLLISKRL